MQDAETVLAIIRERGRNGQHLERVYRQLFNRQLYLLAYGKIYRNDGATTAGVTAETVDGMSLRKIDEIIEKLRSERYRWTPVRRTYIEKKGSNKKRPLGIPTWPDKLVQEVIRLILEAYYEPQFSDHSHGFRAGRGCHTALKSIRQWRGTKWFIEGDITDCFGTLEHSTLISILSEKIHDGRFLRLIGEALKAGYLEDWQFNATLSGAPQGGLISPVLTNVYLDRLDKFVEETLMPVHNVGTSRTRKFNPAYTHARGKMQRAIRDGRREEAKEWRNTMQSLPCYDPKDPNFRRLKYLRYADDVRRITRRWIPPTGRRGSEERTMEATKKERHREQTTSGSTAYPAAKANGDRSMLLKREMSEGVYGIVPQDPCNMVKATLLEAQSPAMEAYIPRLQRLWRGRHDRAIKSSSPEPSAWRAVRSDLTQGDGRDTYVTLETSSVGGMRDRPTGRETQGDGASVLVRGRESRPHGEGRQVLTITQRRKGTRDA